MAKINRPPADIVSSIKQESANVREAASRLTDKITRFRLYLSTLKGRVDTEVYGSHPDFDGDDGGYPVSLGIRLHRDEKNEWELSYGVDHDPEMPTEWKPLVEAPLKLKMAGVKLFRDLLLGIEKTQKKLTSEIDEVSDDFDKLAEELSIPEVESK